MSAFNQVDPAAEFDNLLASLQQLAPWIKNLDQLVTITTADFSAYSQEAQSLIVSTLNAGSAARSLADSTDNLAGSFGQAATAAQAVADANARALETYSRTIAGMQTVVANSRKELLDIYGKESKALEGLATKFTGLGDTIRSFALDLRLGELSTSTPAEKLSLARSEFDSVSTKARLGDAEAIKDLPGVARTFLEISRSFNASGSNFAADFNLVQTTLDQVGTVTDNAANAAIDQLDVLRDTLGEFVNIGQNVAKSVSLTEALVNLLRSEQRLDNHLALAGQSSSGVNPRTVVHLTPLDPVSGSFASGSSFIPRDMVAQIHKGEEVVSASERSSRRNAEHDMVKELKRLTDIVDRLGNAQINQGERLRESVESGNQDVMDSMPVRNPTQGVL